MCVDVYFVVDQVVVELTNKQLNNKVNAAARRDLWDNVWISVMQVPTLKLSYIHHDVCIVHMYVGVVRLNVHSLWVHTTYIVTM